MLAGRVAGETTYLLAMRTLIIDNYDSFTFNLFQLISEVNGEEPIVVRNDQIAWRDIAGLGLDNIVLSPGPGHPANPSDFGVCRDALEQSGLPILGVCLGHQGLGHVSGGQVTHAPVPMHGRLSRVIHSGDPLFAGIPAAFDVVRYHSLILAEPLPASLERIAWTEEDGLVMAVRHRSRPFWGVQYHPESICTSFGRELLANFRELTRRFHETRAPRSQPPSRVLSVVPRAAPVAPVPVRFEVHARNLATAPDPESVFVHLHGQARDAFWLDSSLVDPRLSRFSFMGDASGPHALTVEFRGPGELTIRQQGNQSRQEGKLLDFLARELALRQVDSPELPFDFNCGFVGYLGYELRDECGSPRRFRAPEPDACLILADRLIAFDHQRNEAWLVCLVSRGEGAQAEQWFARMEARLADVPPAQPPVAAPVGEHVPVALSRERETYLGDIQRCLEKIGDGESYEVCLTNKLHLPQAPDPLLYYRLQRRRNPVPYGAFLRFGELAVCCSSPERFLRVERGGWVESKPIKGTRRRGESAEVDEALRRDLASCEKDRAENLMIVDLVRNDLGLVCEVGSVHVPKLMDVETYATVHQLVSTVRGRLRPGLSVVDCVRAAFPGGSMTGAPKLRTMELIDSLELEARGVYSGSIGFIGCSGAADLNIVIRTAVMMPERTTVGVGGAIIALSNPEEEFAEILLKGRSLLETFEQARGAAAPARGDLLEKATG
ncbi:aminodeoxychorismate synthase component I [Archangium violaceum]|nr:aminodeoxychorismate synthase component I [Archangium violaceum]